MRNNPVSVPVSIFIAFFVVFQANATKNDSISLWQLRNKCYNLTEEAAHKDAHNTAISLLHHAQKKENKLYEAYGLYFIGVSEVLIGNADEGKRTLEKTLSIAKDIENDTLFVNIYNALGIYEANKNNHTIATDYFYRALKHAMNLNDKVRQAKVEINLAHIFHSRQDTTGLKFTRDAYNWAVKNNQKTAIPAGYYYAYFLHLQNKNNEAIQLLNNIKSLAENQQYKEMSSIYKLYADIYLATKQYHLATKALNDALNAQKDAQSATIPEIYLTYAKVLSAQNSHIKSNDIAQEGVKIALNNNIYPTLADLYSIISDNYDVLGNKSAALEFHKKHKTINDSLFISEKERAINELSIKYNVEKHERELLHNRQLLSNETQKNTILIIFTSCLLILSITLAAMYRKQRILYKTIAKQNRNAIMQREILMRSIEAESEKGYDTDSKNEHPNESDADDNNSKDADKVQLFTKICRILEKERLFTDSNLTREILAERVGSNRTYLSQAINKNAGMSFSQFINSYRIHEAVKFLSNPENADFPLKALAPTLGFSSMTTFYKQFQTEVGMTPSAYRKTVLNL